MNRLLKPLRIPFGFLRSLGVGGVRTESSRRCDFMLPKSKEAQSCGLI